MKICVKDLIGSGSSHDPLSVSYAVIGGRLINRLDHFSYQIDNVIVKYVEARWSSS